MGTQHGEAHIGDIVAPAARVAWAREVRNAVTTLDTTEQLAIKLVYIHGLSQAEAAQWLSLSTERVARVLATGLQRLAERLTLTPTWHRPADWGSW